MKRFPLILAASVAVFIATATGVATAADVGVSVQVGQPGFYGRIDIGNSPSPVLIYPQPLVITAAPIGIPRQPIYLHVPPGHAKNWGKHCSRYNACGQPVYFVQDNWYNQQYVPQFQQRDRDGYRGDYRGHGRDDHGDRGDRGDRGDNDHGRGQGRGNGNGNGRGRD